MNLSEIREYKEYLVNDLYNELRGEQEIDQSYIDDTFSVPEVKAPHSIIRSGIGYQVVNAPAEQIITSNPQVFILTATKGEQEKANKIAKELNQTWIPILRRQIPNIFKESVKNKMSRGESYIKLSHNEKWVTGRKEKKGMPVLFLMPDPMVVYASPQEDDCGWIPDCGIPNRVVVCYPRQVSDVLLNYPSWSNPEAKNTSSSKAYVDWWEYYDKDTRYFEADGESVLKGGIQPNIYKFTPFIRKYSGFGKRSPEGQLSSLAVSDIRMSRDMIREECAIRSDIASIMHIFAHKPITVILPETSDSDDSKIAKSIDMGAYSVNILHLPESPITKVDFGRESDNMLPSPEVFQHLRDIRAEINSRHPFIIPGFPSGSSGRQQDLASTAAMRRYDTVLENTEEEFATAFDMALDILKKVPSLMPDTFGKEDLAIDYKLAIKLRAKDPIEEDRMATLGSRLFAQHEIDLMTNLTEYKGYTQDEAEDIIINMLVDQVTLNSPDVAQLIGMKAAEKAGMADELNIIRQQRQQLDKSQTLLNSMPMQPPSTQQRIAQGQTQTPMGREMIDQALTNNGQRSAPTGYNRNA